MAVVPGYRLFNVRLARRSEVSPSLLSLVFSGEEVAQMKSDSPDQRIKMLFPAEDGTPPSLPVEGEWYPTLLAIPKISGRLSAPTRCAMSILRVGK